MIEYIGLDLVLFLLGCIVGFKGNIYLRRMYKK